MKTHDPRFLIIDAHPVFQLGLISILSREWPNSEVHGVSEFSKGVDHLRQFEVDLVIAEFRIGPSTILDFLKAVAPGPSPRCLVLSSMEEVRTGTASIRAGASGFLPKTASPGDLSAAIRTLLSGHTWLSDTVARALARGGMADASATEQLTRREAEIFTHLGHGLTVSQVAATLALSVKTVEAHRENIKTKLNLHTAAQVTAAASRWIHDFLI